MQSSSRARSFAASPLDPETDAIPAQSADAELRLPVEASPPTTAPYLSPDTGHREVQQVELARRIDAYLHTGRASVRLTDNVHTMLSVKRRGELLVFRVHHLFADAPPVIVRAMAAYAERHDADAADVLRDYVDRHERKIRAPSLKTAVTKGHRYDLAEIFHALNERYFGGSIDASITWGSRSRRGSRSSIKLGSYTVEDRLIRIHPVLDQPRVPRYFVEWIVYHEMLHQVHEMPIVDGRRVHHTRAFRRDEAKFEHYTAAVLWERVQLQRLL